MSKFGLRKKDYLFLKLGVACSIRSKLPNSTRIVHAFGISIDDNVEVGENCEIFQNTTIGRRWKDIHSKIVIGNNVRICAGAVILGNIKVGDNAIIGANAVVLKDVPAGETWVGVPAKKVVRK